MGSCWAVLSLLLCWRAGVQSRRIYPYQVPVEGGAIVKNLTNYGAEYNVKFDYMIEEEHKASIYYTVVFVAGGETEYSRNRMPLILSGPKWNQLTIGVGAASRGISNIDSKTWHRFEILKSTINEEVNSIYHVKCS